MLPFIHVVSFQQQQQQQQKQQKHQKGRLIVMLNQQEIKEVSQNLPPSFGNSIYGLFIQGALESESFSRSDQFCRKSLLTHESKWSSA